MKVNIYTPIYHRHEKTKLAIETILESIEQSNNDVKLFVGVNGVENIEQRKWIDSLKCENVIIFHASKNVGKASIINEMFIENHDCDYVISIDSDMMAKDNDKYNWIDELVSIMEFPPAMNFGLLSTGQDGMCAHVKGLQPEATTMLNHEIIFGAPHGVAGGCVIMKKEVFMAIGMYHVYDVYSGDDAILMQKISKIGKLVGITTDIKLFHQPNKKEEEAYQKWKHDKCHGKLPIGKDTKGFWG